MTEPHRSNTRTGGQALVDALRIHGCDMAFAVPGESYLAVLDALHDVSDIKLIVARHEGGAAMMADAYGKLTGKPGVAMVTRGPGATNACHGVHIAFQDSTPMILLIGQVGRSMVDREAFQEIDYRRMFGEMAKWVAQIDDPDRVSEYIGRAYHTALSGRPGPVVLALPEDMLTEPSAAPDARPHRIAEPAPTPAAMAELRDRLGRAERPFVIAGGGGWTAAARDDLAAFAEANDLPVGVSFRCQDLMDNAHPNYAGHVGIGINPKLGERVRNADLLLVIGARLGEMTTSGYTLLDVPNPVQDLVHVHQGAEELGRVYSPALPVHATPAAFLHAAVTLDPVDSGRWATAAETAHAEYLAHLEPPETPGPVQMGDIVRSLRATLTDETIIANGAGNYAIWVNRFYQYRGFRTQLAPTNGSMGYGLPAAIAAKLVRPDRPVVCFAGDGCFQMTLNELSTAAQYDLPIVCIVMNNGIYGTIRMHQEREYPGRVSGTALANPDFAKLAEAYGGFGAVVEKTQDFAGAFAAAQAAGTLAVIELRVDPEAVTPTQSISQIRDAALTRKPA